MDRRQYLGVVASVGVVGTAGCGAVAGRQTLTDPTVHADSPQRRSIEWVSNGEAVGELGVSGTVSSGVLDLATELSHREGTTVQSIRLRVWMPQTATDSASEVAVVSPVEGDSSPPPSLSLYTPQRALGTVIEVTDLDDLADETISTLDLLVRPGSETARKLTIDSTIELADSDVFNSGYTLDGELELTFPERGTQ